MPDTDWIKLSIRTVPCKRHPIVFRVLLISYSFFLFFFLLLARLYCAECARRRRPHRRRRDRERCADWPATHRGMPKQKQKHKIKLETTTENKEKKTFESIHKCKSISKLNTERPLCVHAGHGRAKAVKIKTRRTIFFFVLSLLGGNCHQHQKPLGLD